jgi:hypothetical protein
MKKVKKPIKKFVVLKIIRIFATWGEAPFP